MELDPFANKFDWTLVVSFSLSLFDSQPNFTLLVTILRYTTSFIPSSSPFCSPFILAAFTSWFIPLLSSLPCLCPDFRTSALTTREKQRWRQFVSRYPRVIPSPVLRLDASLPGNRRTIWKCSRDYRWINRLSLERQIKEVNPKWLRMFSRVESSAMFRSFFLWYWRRALPQLCFILCLSVVLSLLFCQDQLRAVPFPEYIYIYLFLEEPSFTLGRLFVPPPKDSLINFVTKVPKINPAKLL